MQALDHAYVTDSLFAESLVDIVHLNTGVLEPASDHDPILTYVRSHSSFLLLELTCHFEARVHAVHLVHALDPALQVHIVHCWSFSWSFLYNLRLRSSTKPMQPPVYALKYI